MRLATAVILLASLWIRTAAADRVVPLAIPASGKTGFAAVDAVASGIRFTNTLSPQAAAKNQNLANGSGLAIGDVDGDGRPDLFFAAIDGTNHLYRNLGDWKFEDITGSAGVAGPGRNNSGAVLVDLDGDGDLDLLVSSLGGGVRCYLNDGKARFTDVTAMSGLASNAGSTSMALADVDGDGTLDLYVANYGAFPILRSGPGRATVKQVNGEWIVEGPYADRLRVVNNQVEEIGEAGVLYLNDGHGHFSAVPWNSDHFVDERGKPKPPPADFGLAAHFRDVNGDGFPDLYVCNDLQTPDRLWINDGKGHFREASHLALRKFSYSSMGVDFADLDRDGQLDFLTVEMSPRSHARRIRSLTGPRFVPNVPGRYDYRPEVVRNALFHGNGDGTWSEIAEYGGVTSTDWSWQPVFVDVDLDGHEDLLVASGALYDVQDRDVTERIQSSANARKNPGGTNLMMFPPYPSAISAFRNRGNLTFEDVGGSWGFGTTNYFQSIALADLDGDGDLDLVCNCVNGAPALYRNESLAPRIAVRARGLAPNTAGINARIRVTGGPVAQTQELVSGGRYLSGDDPVRVFAATGAKTFGIEVTWRSGRRSVIADVIPNSLVEVDEASAQTAIPTPPPAKSAPLFADATGRLRHVHHEELFDDFARQPLLHRQFSSLGPGVAWIDLDGDGRDELVVGTGRGGRLGAYRVRTDGDFEPIASGWIAPDDVAGMAAWTMPDGRPALLAAVSNYETAPAGISSIVRVGISTDGKSIEVAPFTDVAGTTSSIGALAVADVDGDGRLDLFAGGRVNAATYPAAPGSRLYRNHGANLLPDAAGTSLLDDAGLVGGATWTDLEGDGFPELVLAIEWGPVRIFRNHRGALERWDPPVEMGSETNVPLSRLTGWWTGVAAGDFDGDGRMDLAVGNWGLNSGYTASAGRPIRLYHGNLAGPETVDVVESYFPADLATEMPRRGRRALAQALPMLADRFPTHAAFGEATMASVLAALPTKPAVETTTTLASMVFLNRGDHFVGVVLPREAQFAPVHGLSVADVDGDGNEDLLLAQNFFAMRIEWPRTDAGRGVVLLGDGHGGFRAMPGDASGVVVHGEQRGCAVADFDGDGRVDWVDTQNGAPTRLFRNATGIPGISVRLNGGAGNPRGIGAVVQTITGGKAGAAREVHSGSGYWSVDSAIPVLAGRPSAIRVRWPGGKTTETAVPPEATTIEIKRE